jgi:hypothetical protein
MKEGGFAEIGDKISRSEPSKRLKWPVFCQISGNCGDFFNFGLAFTARPPL